MTEARTLTQDEIERVTSMSEEELDELPFGTIQLDPEGMILSYNESESKLTGRDPQDVIGKNFFTEVAPCTNVRQFAGSFREGVQSGDLHAVFPYRFDYKMKPRNVWVTLFYSDSSDTAWVFVRERDAPA